MEENSIEIQHLNKYYGNRQALNDISLSIGRGMFGLLGRNGAGKTTLMKTLATLLRKKDGEIRMNGIPIENTKEIRKIIGYLPQEFSIYPSMKVGEAMDYLGILSGLNAGQRKERTDALLAQVNLSDSKGKKVKALSGGMKRRLGIAQALLNDPEILIVDEPTAGLDPEERIRFRNLLCETARDRIVLLSTHIVGDIEAACENIAILDKGRLLYRGTVEELLQDADGRVFTMSVDQKEFRNVKDHYPVTGMHTQGGLLNLRLLSDTPIPGAEACRPDLEDAYMYYLYQNGTPIDACTAEMGGGR